MSLERQIHRMPMMPSMLRTLGVRASVRFLV